MSLRDSSEPSAYGRRGSLGLWFAVLGPPAAWFASLVVSYFSVHEVCRVHSAIAPRVVSLIALAAAVGAGFAGRTLWVRADGGSIAALRTRFLAQIGVLGAATFSLIILLQIVATVLLPPCRERPRTHESPDVLAPPALSPPHLG